MPEQLVRARAATSPEHGHPPKERPVEALLERGCFVLDKPQGPTSHQVAAWARDVLGAKQAGHAGTLDPNVTGVLPVGINQATRVLAELKEQDKAYVGVMTLHEDVPAKRVDEALARFTGDIRQTPPKRSAVKREERTRTVHAFEALEHEGRTVLIGVECQSGTYVRTLVHDVGKHLGTAAHLQELRRTRVAHLTEEHAVTLHDVMDAIEEHRSEDREDWLRATIQPQERFLEHLPKVTIRDTAVDAVCHGAPLAIPGVLDITRGVQPGDRVVIQTIKGEAVALATAAKSDVDTLLAKDGIQARPDRRLMAPGTYPKAWGHDVDEDA